MTDFKRTEDQRRPGDRHRMQVSPPCTWDYAKLVRDKDGSIILESDKDIAFCTCRNGHTTRLVATVHRVAADGAVTPSYVCPVQGCSFHEYVRLLDWDPSHVYEEEQW